MIPWLLATAALAAAPGPALEVRLAPVEQGAALTVAADARLRGVSVRRDGDEVVVRVEGRPAAPPAPPAAVPPVEGLRVGVEPDHLELRARVARSIAFEVRREERTLTVVFGAGAGAPVELADFRSLYRSLFPPGAGEAVPGAGAGEPGPEASQGRGGSSDDGLGFGPLRLRPALTVAYVDGDTTLGPTPRPVRDSYFQIEPHLGATASFSLGSGGHVRAAYEPVFRTRPALIAARRPSHDLDLSLDQPLGPALTLRGSAHALWGVLETNEVDPGREFFFDLGRFRHERYGAGLRFSSGGRLDLDLSASLNRVRFSQAAAFFDYEQRGAVAELGYELSPNLRAGLGYVYAKVPDTASRAEALSRSDGVRFALYGDLAPLVQGEVAVGYERRRSPNAGPGGERFTGLVASARVIKEFSRSATLSLGGSRYTTLSAFEDDAFFVANALDAVATLPLPARLSLRLGAGWHRNDYRTNATALARPRRDTLTGWSAGLGRPLTRWSFARADYRRDRRDSNLDLFDTTTWTFVFQVGVGFLGSPERP